MYLFDLEDVSWRDAMMIFHTLARIGTDALVIVSPREQFVSIGYFQDANEEVDIEYCQQADIPVMRREVGGGAVLLDRGQIFYQLVLNRNNPLVPPTISRLYEEFSAPPIDTYAEFGIKTTFRYVNDIVTDSGKKIAGEGGSNIGNSVVFVGSIIMDFDYKTMSKVLKVPDEKFRDKVYKTMEENLTTMKRELGVLPDRQEVRRVLREKFEKLLGPLEVVSVNKNLEMKIREVESKLITPSFLFKKTMKIPKGVKIREGVELLYGIHKAKGGLVKTAQEIEKELLKDIVISGDFTFYPKEKLSVLENELAGSLRREKLVKSKIEEFYEKSRAESPGVEPEDMIKAMKIEE